MTYHGVKIEIKKKHLYFCHPWYFASCNWKHQNFFSPHHFLIDYIYRVYIKWTEASFLHCEA